MKNEGDLIFLRSCPFSQQTRWLWISLHNYSSFIWRRICRLTICWSPCWRARKIELFWRSSLFSMQQRWIQFCVCRRVFLSMISNRPHLISFFIFFEFFLSITNSLLFFPMPIDLKFSCCYHHHPKPPYQRAHVPSNEHFY